MRLRLVMACVIPSAAIVAAAAGFAVLSACSSSSSSNTSDAGEAGPPCSTSLQNVFNNTSAFCPTDPSGTQIVPYNLALQQLCQCHNYDGNGKCIVIDAGIITAGQCGDYLVYEYAPPGNAGYTKCFYKTSDRTIVGISFSDGTMDQCNNTASVTLGGVTEDYCGFGHIDVNENCAPKPEAGPDAQSD